MVARVIDRILGMNDLYDAVMDRAERKRKAARIERLINRLRKADGLRCCARS
jgi:signal recognition particle GTPase